MKVAEIRESLSTILESLKEADLEFESEQFEQVQRLLSSIEKAASPRARIFDQRYEREEVILSTIKRLGGQATMFQILKALGLGEDKDKYYLVMRALRALLERDALVSAKLAPDYFDTFQVTQKARDLL